MELKVHQDCPWIFLFIRLTHKKTTVCKQLLTNNLGRMLVWVTNCCMYKPRVVGIYETTYFTLPLLHIPLSSGEMKKKFFSSNQITVISQLLLEFNKFHIIWRNVIAFICSVKLQCTIQASIIWPIFFLAQNIDIFCNSSLNHA